MDLLAILELDFEGGAGKGFLHDCNQSQRLFFCHAGYWEFWD